MSSPLKCPECGIELVKEVNLVIYEPFLGTKHPPKIRRTYTYYCRNCKQYYRVGWRLLPCEIVEKKK